MDQRLRAAFASMAASVDARDLIALAGIGLLIYGGERLYPGAGYAAGGAVLVAIAVLVR